VKVRVYIDGFNVYHAIGEMENPSLKWLNHWKLAESLLRPQEVLDEVHFFTAVLTWNADKQKRHVNYIKALKAVGVTVHQANFKKSRKHCREFDRYCNFHEEKQTDVAIAVKLVADALSGDVSRQILMTADSDQIPAAKLVSGLPDVKLSLVFPPGRAKEARDLGNIITDRIELTAGRLGTAQLPRTVHDAQGKAVAFRPAIYDQLP
jgi:uncharacterized LabA/DUF88 family protein